MIPSLSKFFAESEQLLLVIDFQSIDVVYLLLKFFLEPAHLILSSFLKLYIFRPLKLKHLSQLFLIHFKTLIFLLDYGDGG
jgi:hypothetical protein